MSKKVAKKKNNKKEINEIFKNKETIEAIVVIVLLLIFLLLITYFTGWRSKFKILDVDGGKMSFCCPMHLGPDEPECGSFDGRFCGGVLKVEVESKSSKDYFACVIVEFYGENKISLGKNEKCEEIESEDIVTYEIENPYAYVKDYKVSSIRFDTDYMSPITEINEVNKYEDKGLENSDLDDYEYTGKVYDLMSITKSRETADKYVKAINDYLKDEEDYFYNDYKLKYNKTANEKGNTFYNYTSSNGVSFDLIFNNNDKSFHCITIIANKKDDVYNLNFNAIRKAAMYVAGEYDSCTNNENTYSFNCYLAINGNADSYKVEHNNLEIELYVSEPIDSIFTVMNKNDK